MPNPHEGAGLFHLQFVLIFADKPALCLGDLK